MFKTRISYLWLLIFVAIALPGWSGEKIAEKKMKFTWSVESTYPEFKNEKVDESLREWLNTLVAEIMDNVKDFADMSEAEGAFTIGISYEATHPSEQVASVIFDIYTYPSGAAHPSSGLEVKNILLSESRFLSFNDLFKDPQKALEIISQHSKPGIEAYLRSLEIGQADKDIDSLLSDDWFKEGTTPKLENFTCLSLEPEGVRAHFQQYQILPYAFGMPHYLVPLEALLPAGPNEKVWPSLAGK